MHALQGHSNVVNGVAYDRDGRLLASFGNEQLVKIWDAATGQERLTRHMRIRKQPWSPDQEWLPLHMPHLWDLDRADDIHAVEGYAPLGSPDRRTLALIEPGGQITLRDADTGKLLHTLQESGTWPGSIAFSPDGKLLAVSVWGTVQLWDPGSGESIRELRQAQGSISALAFSPDGRRVATGDMEHTVRVWDVATGEQRALLLGHRDMVRSVAFSPDPGAPGRLASASDDGTVLVWDADRDPRFDVIPSGYPNDLLADLGFRGDGQALQVVRRGGVDSGEMFSHEFGGGSQARWPIDGCPRPTWPRSDFAFSRNGQRLAALSSEPTVVKLWDVNTGEETTSLSGQRGRVTGVTWSRDNRYVATASFVRGTELEGSSPKAVHESEQSLSQPAQSEVGPTCEFALWDAGTGRRLLRWDAGPDAASALAFSPDGRQLACGGEGHIRIWDAATGRLERSLQAVQRVVYLDFHDDGRRLAAADFESQTVVVFDPFTGEKLLELAAPRAVCCVRFSPGGRLLAAVGYDSHVQLWSTATGQEILTLRGRPISVGAAGLTARVAFSPDGTRIAANTLGGWVNIWDSRPIAQSGSRRPLLPGERIDSP